MTRIYPEQSSRDILAEQVGESSKQIQRYIRLTELIPELLDMVDNKKLQFTVAVDISYIDKEMQKWIYEYIKDNGFIKPNQIAVLRKRLEDENVGHNYMISIFNNCIAPKRKMRKVTLPEKKLKNYFPPDYTQGADGRDNCFSVGRMEERIADRVRILMKEIVMIKARSAKIKLHRIQMRGGCVWNKKYHLIIFTARRPISTVFIEYRRRYFRMNILKIFPVMRKSFMD